jgi:DNA-binding transcriptional ArsR family regulator
MVVRQGGDEGVDRVFSALGDATRRDILRRTALREHSVSALARDYPVSFAAVQKHVAVLERAGLVVKRRQGREHLVSADVTTVRTAREQLEALEALWRHRLDRFGEILAGLPGPADIPNASPNAISNHEEQDR